MRAFSEWLRPQSPSTSLRRPRVVQRAVVALGVHAISSAAFPKHDRGPRRRWRSPRSKPPSGRRRGAARGRRVKRAQPLLSSSVARSPSALHAVAPARSVASAFAPSAEPAATSRTAGAAHGRAGDGRVESSCAALLMPRATASVRASAARMRSIKVTGDSQMTFDAVGAGGGARKSRIGENSIPRATRRPVPNPGRQIARRQLCRGLRGPRAPNRRAVAAADERYRAIALDRGRPVSGPTGDCRGCAAVAERATRDEGGAVRVHGPACGSVQSAWLPASVPIRMARCCWLAPTLSLRACRSAAMSCGS
jgi:hypothetical protein